MRSKSVVVFLAALSLVVLAFFFSGCTKGPSPDSAPSDADIVKAIENSIQQSPVTRLSPVVIEEKGSRNPDGTWPVKVKFHASTFVNYTERKEFDKEATYMISRSQGNAGKAAWQAAEKQ